MGWLVLGLGDKEWGDCCEWERERERLDMLRDELVVWDWMNDWLGFFLL